MKILLFIDNLGAGGAQRQLAGLAVLLKQNGMSAKVCTYYPQDFYKSYLDENGVENEIVPGADNSKKRIWAVRQYFKKERPDWVIAYQETPSLVACAAKVLGCNYKLLVSERNTTQNVGMNERVRFFLYHFADTIVPNSYAQENWLKQHHPWMVKKITTITNFVDLEKFHYVEHTRREIPLIVVASSLWESKNARGLITACRTLKDRGVKFNVKWFGLNDTVTDYEKETLTMVAALGVDDIIQFLPKTKQIELEYRKADYFCLPSFFEGTPNVICEAISTGLPVICSDICDNGIYVKHDVNGILFNPKEPEDISQKIQDILSQTIGDYQRFRTNSRKVAEQLLSKDLFINKYKAILHQ